MFIPLEGFYVKFFIQTLNSIYDTQPIIGMVSSPLMFLFYSHLFQSQSGLKSWPCQPIPFIHISMMSIPLDLGFSRNGDFFCEKFALFQTKFYFCELLRMMKNKFCALFRITRNNICAFLCKIICAKNKIVLKATFCAKTKYLRKTKF